MKMLESLVILVVAAVAGCSSGGAVTCSTGQGFDPLGPGVESWQFVSKDCTRVGGSFDFLAAGAMFENILGDQAMITAGTCDEIWSLTRNGDEYSGTYEMSYQCSSINCQAGPEQTHETGYYQWPVPYNNGVTTEYYMVVVPDSGINSGCEIALTRLR